MVESKTRTPNLPLQEEEKISPNGSGYLSGDYKPLTPDASGVSPNGSINHEVFLDRERDTLHFLQGKGDEGATRFNISSHIQGRHREMSPRFAESMMSMIGHKLKHYPDSIPEEFQNGMIVFEETKYSFRSSEESME